MDLSPSAWATVAQTSVSVIAAAGSVAVAIIARRGRQDAVDAKDAAVGAKDAAQTAAANSEPVSNGFAARVTGLLEHVAAQQEATRADVASLRDEVADDRRALVRHLGDHAAGGADPRAIAS